MTLRLSLAGTVRVIGFAVLTLTLGGCPSFYNMGTARPVAEGQMEFHSTLAYNGIAAGTLTPAAETDSSTQSATQESPDADVSIMLPIIDVGYRMGIAENMDFGVAVKNIGNLRFDLKIALLDTEQLTVSVAPEVGGLFIGAGESSVGYVQYDLPLLVDFHPNDKLTVTLAAKYSGVFSFAGGETSGIANLVGGTVGLNIKLGDSFALHPYAGVTLSMDQDVITFPHGGIGARFSL